MAAPDAGVRFLSQNRFGMEERMGLQFCIGSSGAGKSTEVYRWVIERSIKEPQRRFLVLVPDQFTMQTQLDLVQMHERRGIMNIDVLSLGRLAHRVFEEMGGVDRPMLDDTGKSLIVRKLAVEVREQMPLLGGNLDKTGYVHEVKSAISEFMQYGVTAEGLKTLQEFAGKRGQLCQKLKDLGILYEKFLAFTGREFLTSEVSMQLLGECLQQSRLVRDSVVVFDGFTGFTPVQYQVLQEIFRLAQDVVVTISMDASEAAEGKAGVLDEQELFYLSKKTMGSLRRLAEEAGVLVKENWLLQPACLPRFEKSPDLAHLERHLFRYPEQARQEAPEQIRVLEASSQQEEVRQICIAIRQLVREKGCCYRDIGVIAGDLSSYQSCMEEQFQVYGIPFYLDRTRGITHNPFIEFMKSALQIPVQHYSYPAVFHYLRSGLASFTPEEIDRLENYVIALGIRGRQKWSQLFVYKSEDMGERMEELTELNRLRERLMDQLEPLEQPARTVEERVRNLYAFLVRSGAEEKLEEYRRQFEEKGDLVRAREYAQVYRLVMELLNQIVVLAGEEQTDREQFARLLESGFEEIQVGTIPQNVDRILVGDMERTRLKQVKYLFFAGVNDGAIPKNAGGGGIISDLEREFLAGSGLELAPAPREQMYIQRLYLYLHLTKPSDGLILSFARMDREGKALRPSYLIGTLGRLFPALQVELPEQAPLEEKLQTFQDAREYLVRGLRDYADGGYRHHPEEERRFFTLYHLFEKQEEEALWTARMTKQAFYQYRETALGKAVAAALYGQTLSGSVSRLEQYAACAYAHFLRYGLLLKERGEYRLEAVDLGNIFHGVLEIFAEKLKEQGYTWFDFPKETGEALVEEAVEAFAVSYGNTVLYDTARNEYMITRIKRILKRTVQTLQYQLKQGSFVPEQFEVAFSVLEDLDAVNIALSEQEKMRLRGRIDRLDVSEDERHVYVKVIDYKSGSRDFSLAALYYGLQLQLVVYLNAAMEMEQKKHPDKEIVPAAMLYYRVQDPVIEGEAAMSEEEINEKIRARLRTTGLVNEREDVIGRLDGAFAEKSAVIPVERKKDGSFHARSSTAGQEDFQVISEFVTHKIRTIGKEILEGRIAVDPYEQGGRDACTYCAYQKVCGFDRKVAGFEKRELDRMEDGEALERMRQAIGAAEADADPLSDAARAREGRDGSERTWQ